MIRVSIWLSFFILLSFSVNLFAYVTRDTAPDPVRMRAETLMLDGTWSCTFTMPDGSMQQHKITAPYSPQSKVNGVEIPEFGAVHIACERQFDVPADWRGGIMHFEGVDYEFSLWINGKKGGEHIGAYDPSSFDVSELIRKGATNTIHLIIKDSADDRNILSGKQQRRKYEGSIFYGNMSGIWKSSWIEEVGNTYFDLTTLQILADHEGLLELFLDVKGESEGYKVRFSLRYEDEPDQIVNVELPVENGKVKYQDILENVKPWEPGNPNLYFGNLQLVAPNGRVVDKFDTYTGFRTFDFKHGYLRLNGKHFYVQGLLNQAVYPETDYTPTDQDTLTDIENGQLEGFTGERRHQTTPRHRDLWLMDRHGYWSTIEMPSARNLSRIADRNQALLEWQRIIKAYAFNHPGVLWLVGGNEDWGLLEHQHHEVKVPHYLREEFQYEMGLATEDVAPPGMLYAAGEGWRLVTSHHMGEPITRINPKRMMFNIHEYADSEYIAETYGSIPFIPSPQTWPERIRGHVFHSDGYRYDGQAPLMLSEIWGRKLTADGFGYGEPYKDPLVWTQDLANMLTVIGALPGIPGGVVVTQARNVVDVTGKRFLGEPNGLADQNGVRLTQGKLVSEANQRARLLQNGLYQAKKCLRTFSK